ncbi:MAG: metallophosphoesterase [Oscillospiraceae bacterium]|nr:metallophosphoesterase [Oscillospiraceae bacterium]
MTERREAVRLRGIRRTYRLLLISDVHFSILTSQHQNLAVTQEILRRLHGRIDAVCVTGDLVSRKPGKTGIPDALRLMQELGRYARVVYSLGNHETDMPPEARKAWIRRIKRIGVTVLDNTSCHVGELRLTGLTLPGDVYRHEDGSFKDLRRITPGLVRRCAGKAEDHQILLAHNPLGLPAYAAWGAQLVLSGHVHGGVIRVPVLGGLLSPERTFFPRYTKGLYEMHGCRMEVSAGIGKLRFANPPEIVYVKILPEHSRS